MQTIRVSAATKWVPSRLRRRQALGLAVMGTVAGLTAFPLAKAQSPSGQPNPFRQSQAAGVAAVDFGPNVMVFDPTMPPAAIQAKLDSVFKIQESNQFGSERYAFLFKPGSYAVDANIGFYTQIQGLGPLPDDVLIKGNVRAEADWFHDNGTCNFWRGAENLSVVPKDGTNRWAVSQAAPFRRMHIQGKLQLDPRGHGWSSGGFIADTKVDGNVSSGSQQQYISRNDSFGSWSGSVWNMVFVGVEGGPSQHFPNPSHTVADKTPIIREKPFLYTDRAGSYQMFVPALRANVSGISWSSGNEAGTNLPLGRFFIAKPSMTAAEINGALSQGKDLLFTPGIYHLEQTIKVSRPNTVVYGLGFPTLMPENGVIGMQIADVDGVKVAGILFDAGAVSSPVLLQVGAPGSTAIHAGNPTSLHDVFARIGGAAPGKVEVSLQINSSNVIVDHTWLWRADHGAGVGWNVNTAENGLVVNGNDVTTYGLFVEHFQKNNVLWNGNGGKTFLFQNELPYDVPDEASWMNGTTKGYAAYKVANQVTTHEAWGVGSYIYASAFPDLEVDNGFEAPNKQGVKFHDLLTVSLGGKGTISHVVDNTGAPTSKKTTPSYIPSYPAQ